MLSQELTTTWTCAIIHGEIVIVFTIKTTLEFVHAIAIDGKQLRNVRYSKIFLQFDTNCCC